VWCVNITSTTTQQLIKEKLMNTLTSITVDIEAGEVAVFKVLPLTSFEEFCLNVSDVDCIDDVLMGEQFGLWEIH
tara:strand:- start:494 stop:718 length:225 start_codon:yes stop_codon:yes gene_type:complete